MATPYAAPAAAASNLPVPAAPGGPTPPMAAPLQGDVLPPAPTFYDVTVTSTRKLAQVRIMGVPPEEFGIERSARSISESNYCYHDVVTKTEAQLVGEGYDEEQIKGLSPYTGLTDIETLQRDTVQEHLFRTDDDINTAQRLVRITEHYIRLDYKGTGRPCLYKVVTGGEKGEILRKDGKPDIEPFDAMPFAAATPIPVTHRFFGRSIADVVMPTQREKTAMKRGALDNLYLANNPRVEVAQDHATANTLDDLLVSRPGSLVRVKTPGGINWQVVPNITEGIFPAMQYLDAELESRTGLAKQAQGIDANALQNQSATAVAQVFSASQMRVKLVARIMAEGVRDMASLIHATIRKHGQQKQTVQLRHKWIDVDPREWKTRDHMTINVGLGTGGKAQQFAQTMAIGNVQKEMVAAGMTNIVGPTELYNTACELTKIMGHKNANKFFKDPDAKDPQTGQLLNPPPPPRPDPKTQAIQAQGQVDMAKTQQQAQHDQAAAQQDFIHQQVKAQTDAALTQLKAEMEAKLKLFDAALEARREGRNAQHDHERHRLNLASDVAGIISTAHKHDLEVANRGADNARQDQLAAQQAAANQGVNDGN